MRTGILFVTALLAGGNAVAATPDERFLALSMDICLPATNGTVENLATRVQKIPDLRLSPAKPLPEGSKFRELISRTLGVRPEEPVLGVFFHDEQVASDVFMFSRTDLKGCIVSLVGKSTAHESLISRLNAVDSGWVEIISPIEQRSWQHKSDDKVVSSMLLHTDGVTMVSTFMDVPEMPRLSVYSDVAGTIVPACLAGLLEKRPLDPAMLGAGYKSQGTDKKGKTIWLQDDFPHARVVVEKEPGCSVVVGGRQLRSQPIEQAFVAAFQAQPGAERVIPAKKKYANMTVWRIRDQPAYMVIASLPEFMTAKFTRDADL